MTAIGPNEPSPLLEITDLTRRFGAKTALAGVSLSISPGGVHGLVGANGAGKTTLIRHILGLLRAEGGTVRVFGLDPVDDPVGVLSRIGYLSEEDTLPAWMHVDELLRYSRAFYPNWDDDYADELLDAFGLSPTARVGSLSKGQRARAGLLVALAYRPELLVLDEPSSGLDPIVRRDILAAALRTVADDGRTVLFSSHLLDEVEQVADHVTMIRRGKIVLSASLQAIHAEHRALTFRLREPSAQPPGFGGVAGWVGGGREWTAVVRGQPKELVASFRSGEAELVDERTATLARSFSPAWVKRRLETPEPCAHPRPPSPGRSWRVTVGGSPH